MRWGSLTCQKYVARQWQGQDWNFCLLVTNWYRCAMFPVLERAFMVFVMMMMMFVALLWISYGYCIHSHLMLTTVLWYYVLSFTTEIIKVLFWLYFATEETNPNLMSVNNSFSIPQGFCELVIWAGFVLVPLLLLAALTVVTQWSSAGGWACLQGPWGSTHGWSLRRNGRIWPPVGLLATMIVLHVFLKITGLLFLKKYIFYRF